MMESIKEFKQLKTGDIISLIHSNDISLTPNVISKIDNIFKNNTDFDIILANLNF